MHLLLLIPGLSKAYTDNYWAYKAMAEREHPILVITNRMSNRTGEALPKKSSHGNLKIYRIFKTSREQTSFFNLRENLRRIDTLVSGFHPDVIISSQHRNTWLADRISQVYDIPIVSIVEFAHKPEGSMLGEFGGFLNPISLLGNKLSSTDFTLGNKIFNFLFWRWFCSKSSAIITCNPLDSERLGEIKTYNTPIYYVPWPTRITYHPKGDEDPSPWGVFIGSLTPHKNIHEFRITLPRILKKTPTEKFYIIGSGKNSDIAQNLKNTFPEKVVYKESLPREKCLELISNSYFAYCPARHGSWGFIINAWAMKTPLIASHNHFNFNHEKDSLVLDSTKKIDKVVNELYLNDTLYQKLQKNGFKRFNDHRATNVARKYILICKKAIEKYGKTNL